MWNIEELVLGIWLCILAIEDWRTRSISVKWLAGAGVLVVGVLIMSDMTTMEFWSHVIGGACGGIFLVIGKISHEKLGYGDGWILVILGSYLGIQKFLEIGLGAFLLCFLYGIVEKLRKGGRREEGVPFVPFLFGSYLGVIIEGKSIRLKGSATIEMLYIMPVIFLVFMAAVYMSFYFHDKNVLQSVTYEAALIGSSQYRDADGTQETEIIEFIEENSAKKLLFFPVPNIELSITNSEIIVKTSTSKNYMNLNIEKRLPLTTPETEIRTRYIIEGVLDGSE